MIPEPGNGAADRLMGIVTMLEDLEADRDGINAQMRDIRKQAKGDGFDIPTIAMLMKRRKLDPEAVIEADALLETYELALGCGAAAVGILSMVRGADGVFEAKMLSGPAAGEEKLTQKTKARRAAVALAELSRRARDL
jgi:uncharacterized protein (UPF0335 family)